MHFFLFVLSRSIFYLIVIFNKFRLQITNWISAGQWITGTLNLSIKNKSGYGRSIVIQLNMDTALKKKKSEQGSN